jgi:hypothetical protein
VENFVASDKPQMTFKYGAENMLLHDRLLRTGARIHYLLLFNSSIGYANIAYLV